MFESSFIYVDNNNTILTNVFPINSSHFPGIGIILVTISATAWRITSTGSSTCLGISSADLSRCSRRPYRSQHGLLYPEFQHRQPPPSYQASMQEYRLR